MSSNRNWLLKIKQTFDHVQFEPSLINVQNANMAKEISIPIMLKVPLSLAPL